MTRSFLGAGVDLGIIAWLCRGYFHARWSFQAPPSDPAQVSQSPDRNHNPASICGIFKSDWGLAGPATA